jgi:hypothetical protein
MPRKLNRYSDRDIAETHKAKMRRFLYGIGDFDFNAMVSAADNKCQICGLGFDEKNNPPCVDHDHVSGKIRGLLCRKCNAMLGFARDQVTILESGIQYLKKG